MDERILASPLAHALARSLNLCDHDNSNIIACCICLEGLLDLIRRGFCTRHARLLVSITRQTQLQLNRRQRARAHGLLGVTTRKLEFFDASTSPMPASRNPVTVSSSPIRHMSLSAFMANAGAAIALPQVHHNIVTGSLIEVQTVLTPASQDGRESRPDQISSGRHLKHVRSTRRRVGGFCLPRHGSTARQSLTQPRPNSCSMRRASWTHCSCRGTPEVHRGLPRDASQEVRCRACGHSRAATATRPQWIAAQRPTS